MCGISGVISQNQTDIHYDLLESLFHIQHRGQDSVGICVFDKDYSHLIQKEGLVDSLWYDTKNIKGNIGIGQVRYPTSGVMNHNEIQPFFSKNQKFSLCHNGNISNYNELCNHNLILETKSDTEFIFKFIEKELSLLENINDSNIITIIQKLSNILIGSFSIILCIQNYGIIGFKDPYGIKPLVYGKKDNYYMMNSETIALDALGYEVVEEIKGGEIICIHNDLTISKTQYANFIQKPCIFEWIYIQRAESVFHSVPVYEARLKLGEYLGFKIQKEINCNDIDMIIPIPETSKPVAIKIAEVLKKPYRDCILKNRYITRTFIMDNNYKRNKNIERKFGVAKSIICNKNIIIVDDSIVRGNTIKKVVELLHKNGANKIIVASCAPPIYYPNYYGIDIKTKEELILNQKQICEIEKEYNIEKIIYQSLNDMTQAITSINPLITNFEMSIFNGIYL